jgi:thioredoxin reductase (NADPH)
MTPQYDVIIIGGGPAGMAAGIYAARAKLRTLILEKETPGGELMNVEWIENYPGFAEGVLGSELGSNMMMQSAKFGAELQMADVEKIVPGNDEKTVKTAQGDFTTRAIIIASGSHSRKIGVPGEAELTNKGVFYCATCDGAKFAGKEVAVAGGGDSGLTEALFLTRFATKVTVIELMPQMLANKTLQEKALENPKLAVKVATKIEAVHGSSHVESLDLSDAKTGQKSSLKVEGLLVRVGMIPNTAFLKGTVALNHGGQVIVNERMETDIPGIFAAGDVRANSPMQVVTAVSDGATAAMRLLKYIEVA